LKYFNANVEKVIVVVTGVGFSITGVGFSHNVNRCGKNSTLLQFNNFSSFKSIFPNTRFFQILIKPVETRVVLSTSNALYVSIKPLSHGGWDFIAT